MGEGRHQSGAHCTGVRHLCCKGRRACRSGVIRAVDVLKIDQSFVRDMLDDPNDRGIVESILRLAQVFPRTVIAEGVETLEHGTMLVGLGCRLCQGYGIARPMPAAQLPAWIEQWRPPWAHFAKTSGDAAAMPV